MPVAFTGGRFQSFEAIIRNTQTAGRFASRANRSVITGGRFKSFQVKLVQTGGRFNARVVRVAVPGGARFRNFIQERRTIHVRNTVTDIVTEIGELLPGQTTLTDVALPDGTYEADVRSDRHYWQDTRSRIRFTFEIAAGVLANQGIPNIQSIGASITSQFQRLISWSIPDVNFDPDLKFGLWRSTVSPVVVTGPPDFTMNAFDGVGAYSKVLDQTEDEYFAVAAFTPIDQGPEKEIFASWDLNAEPSPTQYGY